ncbi:amino acid permease [Dyella monticola]|uniref:Arginine/agmatine antiporter n=1 Tax=Dyella monticola TaxID=1927958 RepID=A0A370WYG3_9GAMM|nr:amino acid permease [Dyella monticola]RDS81162.1 amino acid permease [Dyella monticola]
MSTAKRSLGLWMLIALVIGNIIGSGVFVLPAALAPYGAASLLGWGISLGGALMLALVYAWLAQIVPNYGGAYAYARRAFGDRVGFIVAWSYWVCVWSANAAIAVAFAGSLGAVWPAASSTPWHGALCALAALWFCTFISLSGVREAGYAAIITTSLKLVPLVVFGALGLGWVHASAFHPFNPSHLPLVNVASAVAALTLWAFLGLETATVPTGVVRDPQRTVPRATVIGMAIAGVATMLACTVVVGMLPADVLHASAAPMAEAARRTWGGWAGIGIGVVATVSCFGALNGWVLLQAQTTLAPALDGLFPRAFARLDKRGTPWFGLVLSSVLASALIVSNYSRTLVALFTFTILLSTAATLVPYLITVLAWWRIDLTGSRWRRSVALGALAFCVWALIGTGAETLMWGAVLLLAGVPMYLWQRRALVGRTRVARG